MRVERIIPERQTDRKEDELDLTALEAILEKYKESKGSLIPILQKTQELYGYIPEAAFYRIAEKTGLKTSDLYGVATFYAQFRLKPVGKHIIKVCHGTACHVQGANKISEALAEALKVKDGETTEDRLFTLESVACLGCCSLAPVMMIGEETYGKLDDKKAVKIIKEIRLSEKN